MEKEKDGVWRTIRGRRIFIASGQSLGEAMAKSGKFSRDDVRVGKHQAKHENLEKKFLFTKRKGKTKKEQDLDFQNKGQKYRAEWSKDYPSYNEPNRQAEKNRINENSHIEGSGKTRVQRNWNKYSEADRTEHRHELIQKKLKEYKDKTMSPVHGWTLSMYEDIEKNGKQAREGMYQQEQKEKSRKAIADYKSKKQSNNKVNFETFDAEKDLKIGDTYIDANGDLRKVLDRPQDKLLERKLAKAFVPGKQDLKGTQWETKKIRQATDEDYATYPSVRNENAGGKYTKKLQEKQETIKNYVEKKQSNNAQTTNRILERSGKVNQKTLKSYADDGLATDITRYSDKDIDKLEKKHGRLTHLKTSMGTYGMNGALLKSEKTGEYFVITSRNGNLFRLV